MSTQTQPRTSADRLAHRSYVCSSIANLSASTAILQISLNHARSTWPYDRVGSKPAGVASRNGASRCQRHDLVVVCSAVDVE